ncbi:MAG TPA: Flp pilus assembly protein CpaB [Acetobacteraceae bacterium]|jgi:pilus assembly protein CpaB|nr:Flp pilus assembly protein CpaB [Acetobacteraceae bacterium]
MVLRVTFFALMALGLLGLGFIGFAATRPPHEATGAPPPPVTARILTAARDIPAGNLVKPGDLSTKEVPLASVPAGSTMDTEEERRGIVGAMLRRGLNYGEPIRLADALRPGDHGFLAAVLKGDMRAVTVGVDAITSTAGLIWPGDRVDLILTQNIGDAALPIGRRVVAETVVSDIRVIAIDQRMVEGAANGGPTPDARTVTLEVNKDQAQAVQVAIRLGRLSLSVRPADEVSTVSTRHPAPVTTFASDVSPALSADLVPPVPAAQSIKIWSGASEGKDFKF